MIKVLKESKVNLARMGILALLELLALPELRGLKEYKANKVPLEILAASVPKEKSVSSVLLDRKVNPGQLANLDILDL